MPRILHAWIIHLPVTMGPNEHVRTVQEWEAIADLLAPGVERIVLAGVKLPDASPSQAEHVIKNPRPLSPGRGRKAREQWVIDYLRFSGAASRKEIVEASGIPNSTVGRILQDMLRDGQLVANGATNTREYSLQL